MAATRVRSGSEETMEEGIVIVASAEWEDTDPVMVGMILALSHSINMFRDIFSFAHPSVRASWGPAKNLKSKLHHHAQLQRPRKRKTDPYSGAMRA
jgi:hypothetical protein